MPALAQHTVWTAYLSPSTDTVAVGKVLVLNSARTFYVVATTAARAAAAHRCAGIALTAGDSTTPAVELQSVGEISATVSGLAAGSASWVRVSSTGTLERCTPAGGDEIVGYCDADGTTHLSFGAPFPTSSTSAPTGTGFRHVTSGTEDAATKLVENADVSGTAAIAASKVVQATGTGFPHVTSGALDAASVKVDTTNAAHVTVPATSGGVVTTDGTKLQQAADVLAGSGYVSVGATPATAGTGIRIANAGGIYARNAGNTANVTLAEVDASNACSFGLGAAFGVVYGTSWTGFHDGSAYTFRCGVSGAANQSTYPITGLNTAYGVHGLGEQAMADADQTPGAAVYCYGAIKTTGALTADRNLTLPAAASDDQGYSKWINNTCTGAHNVVVTTGGAGTTVSVANGKSAFVFIDSRGVTRMTADV